MKLLEHQLRVVASQLHHLSESRERELGVGKNYLFSGYFSARGFMSFCCCCMGCCTVAGEKPSWNISPLQLSNYFLEVAMQKSGLLFFSAPLQIFVFGKCLLATGDLTGEVGTTSAFAFLTVKCILAC